MATYGGNKATYVDPRDLYDKIVSTYGAPLNSGISNSSLQQDVQPTPTPTPQPDTDSTGRTDASGANYGATAGSSDAERIWNALKAASAGYNPAGSGDWLTKYHDPLVNNILPSAMSQFGGADRILNAMNNQSGKALNAAYSAASVWDPNLADVTYYDRTGSAAGDDDTGRIFSVNGYFPVNEWGNDIRYGDRKKLAPGSLWT